MRPASTVLRWTDREIAVFNLSNAAPIVPMLEAAYAYACKTLGDANRMRSPMRRFWQAKAFREINRIRAQLRAARKDLAVAQMAMLMLEPAALAA